MTNTVQMLVRLDDDSFSIPYGAEQYEEGEIHPYRRLVNNPSAIKAIPEIEGFPFLEDFLLKVNRPGGLMETARMVRWYTETDSVVHCFGVGMHFQDRSQFTRYDQALVFAGNLLQTILPTGCFPLDQQPLMIELQRCQLKEEQVSGWILDMFVFGYGKSEGESDADLDRKLHIVAEVL
ncbi:hypothetical protein HNO52_05420 [Billgrantia diversa]|uniref:hypothetical protein n=1 Tax=Halomonas sp. MCCC 1A13316 TaxID=2733487 RepID=UPI0018A42561|nr:hypothetical protein [Halomonas sp. MCCC 1A13316]QOR38007.1 hypothetical protein HNO52_05420 [Halomonas sp. MCCC 1A13316]